jgi:ParB-like chromosome segregation protein Spo0J
VQNGIIEPLIAYPKDCKYHILAGNKRLYAARELGLSKVPVMIFADATAKDAALVNLVEMHIDSTSV